MVSSLISGKAPAGLPDSAQTCADEADPRYACLSARSLCPGDEAAAAFFGRREKIGRPRGGRKEREREALLAEKLRGELPPVPALTQCIPCGPLGGASYAAALAALGFEGVDELGDEAAQSLIASMAGMTIGGQSCRCCGLLARANLSGLLLDRPMVLADAEGENAPQGQKGRFCDLLLCGSDGGYSPYAVLPEGIVKAVREAAGRTPISHALLWVEAAAPGESACCASLREALARAAAEIFERSGVAAQLRVVPSTLTPEWRSARRQPLPSEAEVLIRFGAPTMASRLFSPAAKLPATLKAVLDLTPGAIRTKLSLDAQAAGIPAADPIDVKLAAAEEAASLLFGRCAQLSGARTARDRLAKRTENIVLIGMPGCGKTTIGRSLAQRLSRRFIDLDQLIVRRLGRPKSEIYLNDGEAYFRREETKTLLEVLYRAGECGLTDGLVIATGGGAVLRPVNRTILSLNGRFLWLKRPLENLSTRDRPTVILKGVDAIYKEREPIYAALAQCTVDVGTVLQTVSDILEVVPALAAEADQAR